MADVVRSVEAVIQDVHLPAGIAGPAEVSFDVRCFLMPARDAVVLVDTGMAGILPGIEAALERPPGTGSLGCRGSRLRWEQTLQAVGIVGHGFGEGQ